MQEFTIADAWPELDARRLKVRLMVRAAQGPPFAATLPDREVAAVLPRRLLAGSVSRVPVQLLGSIAAVLRRAVIGREVRLWEYRERTYASFPSWRPVRFLTGQTAEPGVHENAERHRHVEGTLGPGHGNGDPAR